MIGVWRPNPNPKGIGITIKNVDTSKQIARINKTVNLTKFCTFPYYWAITKLGFVASTNELYWLPEGYTNTSTIREQEVLKC